MPGLRWRLILQLISRVSNRMRSFPWPLRLPERQLWPPPSPCSPRHRLATAVPAHPPGQGHGETRQELERASD